MKYTIRIVLLLIILLCFSYSPVSGEGLVFGIKSGMGIQSSYLGINQGNQLTLMGGLDLVKIGGEMTREEETKDGYHYKDSIDSVEFSVRAFVPYGGLKHYIKKIEEKVVSPYLFGAVFKCFPKADFGDDEEMEKTIEDVLDFWGIIFAGGAEYYFSPSFSIGGEFGIRLFFVSSKHEERDRYYDYYEKRYIETVETVKIDSRMDVTYTAITLNYRF